MSQQWQSSATILAHLWTMKYEAWKVLTGLGPTIAIDDGELKLVPVKRKHISVRTVHILPHVTQQTRISNIFSIQIQLHTVSNCELVYTGSSLDTTIHYLFNFFPLLWHISFKWNITSPSASRKFDPVCRLNSVVAHQTNWTRNDQSV